MENLAREVDSCEWIGFERQAKLPSKFQVNMVQSHVSAAGSLQLPPAVLGALRIDVLGVASVCSLRP